MALKAEWKMVISNSCRMNQFSVFVGGEFFVCDIWQLVGFDAFQTTFGAEGQAIRFSFGFLAHL